MRGVEETAKKPKKKTIRLGVREREIFFDKEPVLPCCGKSRKNIHHSTALDELNPKMYFIFAKWHFRDFRKPIDFATQDSTFRFEMTWTGMRNVVE